MKHILLTTVAAMVLVGCGPSEPPDISIIEAAFRGNFKAIKQHLANGADVNTKDGGGLTPLHWAALRGHKEVVELLINNDADMNAKSYDYTPLNWAKRHPETADLLRKHGGKTGEELKAEGK